MFKKVAYFFSRPCSLEIEIITWNYLAMKLGQLIDIAMGNIFGKCIEWFCGMEPKFRLFLVWERTAANQKQTLMSLWFFTPFEVCTETIKYSKHQLKINRSPFYCHVCRIVITLHRIILTFYQNYNSNKN